MKSNRAQTKVGRRAATRRHHPRRNVSRLNGALARRRLLRISHIRREVAKSDKSKKILKTKEVDMRIGRKPERETQS